MPTLKLEDVYNFVDNNIDSFHSGKLVAIKRLKLSKLLKRKNPYLFKAKNVTTSEELVRKLLSAYVSSQEETMFGNFLEKLAIFVNQRAFGGKKSPAEGLDLDFTRDNMRYLVSIKSGPNWGNSSQIKKMRDYFSQARRILGQNIICVNGCCYGKNRNENKGDYFKKCGQSFWELISGDLEFYKKIVEPIGIKAKTRNEEFQKEYGKVINRFSREFINNFCDDDGAIDWEKLVEFNSGIDKKVEYKTLEKF
jgi:hypothetical protein